jgi:hypothetical protein
MYVLLFPSDQAKQRRDQSRLAQCCDGFKITRSLERVVTGAFFYCPSHAHTLDIDHGKQIQNSEKYMYGLVETSYKLNNFGTT